MPWNGFWVEVSAFSFFRPRQPSATISRVFREYDGCCWRVKSSVGTSSRRYVCVSHQRTVQLFSVSISSLPAGTELSL